ncbi:GlxA family transcriptional regulator [Rhodobaculum claviforme]|uniref:AraC family transcriptional regulator n=1 Tax=Rhodobaculum claviforme TaxID=1549854 RepID=A0A934WK61_9RHOB|nr:GlxA family transcriptional regulator [Rhodobaculum claviforme]MBK5928213.1 AraC family transcriptional regulator [Rhodobaculum claviforme]
MPAQTVPALPHRPAARATPAPRRRFVLLLLDRFSMLALAAAMEALRIANRMLGQPAYAWVLVGEGGTVARASTGTEFRLDHGLEAGELEVDRDDVVLAIGGLDVQAATTRAVVNWLRRVARHGPTLGGMCTGSHALARAGLLEGRRATIHWENHDSFAEEFEDVTLTKSVFVVDGNRLSAAGGTSAIDLMLALIARDHGEGTASAVADQLIYAAIRTDQDTQRLSIPTRIGVRHPKLAQVVRIMEANIEEPISPADLAATVGLSTRQLERLARRYLGRSPKRYYMEMRLQRARNLLMQTDMSVINVAIACGFTSPSHFSKCYRAHYGITPYRERGAHGARADVAALPADHDG